MRLRLLFALLAFGLVATACSETGEHEGNNSKIEILTENPMWIDCEAGIYEIEYTIKNPSNGTKLGAEIDASWASIVEIKSDAVSFLVKKNDGASDRSATITLIYGGAKAKIEICQRVKIDQTFTATTTAGSEFTHCNNEAGVHNYRLVLSRDGLRDDGSFYASSTYYVFDLCATEVVSKEAASATIPNGTYRLSNSEEVVDRSINVMYSYYWYMNAEYGFNDAEVVVEDGRVVANIAIGNGENHRVEYSGSLVIPVYNATVTEGLSTLTSNHTFNIENGVFVGAFVGDLMYNGCNTCQVFMYEYLDYETGEERGDQFQIDLQLPAGSRDVCGTYTHGTTAGHFIPGSAEDLGGQYMQQNSWYMTAGYIDFAPLVRGNIKVERESEYVYLFTLDTVDDRGNAIKGTFRGSGEFIDW